ncbi:hypothetical protein AOQ84DRAFT_225623 [Glonium stellatum]|uniref:Uncharacterized protein n=1 Tax=Glonium stellatum TaxID=574774 RepID=A0A8E2JXL7_9PEZI|nr:hypothetical protein AOQ84DRAFT_225623 [Glonium stellatum]
MIGASSLPYLTLLSLLALLLPSLSHAAATCYFPDTTEASHDFPCYPDRDISVCCGPGFACLPNGICEVTSDAVNPGVSYPFVRGSCTDKTWASTACPQFCATTGYSLDGGNTMMACNETADTFCCLGGNGPGQPAACDCTSGVNITTLEGGVVAFTTIGIVGTSTSSSSSSSSSTPASSASSASSTSASTSASTTAASATATATSSPSPSSSSASTSSASLSPGAKAGIGIGVPLGALLLSGLGYLLWRDRQRSQKMKALQLQGHGGGANGASGGYGYGQFAKPPEYAHRGEVVGGEVGPGGYAHVAPTYELGSGERYEMDAPKP